MDMHGFHNANYAWQPTSGDVSGECSDAFTAATTTHVAPRARYGKAQGLELSLLHDEKAGPSGYRGTRGL
jgi:hypothetical protein